MPIYRNQSRTVAFQSLTLAGAPNTSTTPSVQVSLDGGAFVNSTNPPTHIGNGAWRLTLTAAEMNADLVTLVATASGAVNAQREIYTESDWTGARAVKVDNADVAVSTRLAASGYSSPPSTNAIATAILATPSNKLVTSAAGEVTLNLAQPVPTSNPAQSVGDSLNAARAQGFGKWTLDFALKTLTLFAGDNVTPVKVFTLDSVTAPTVRS